MMDAKLTVSNRSRTDDFTLLLDGHPVLTVRPLATEEVDVSAGQYSVAVQGANEEGLPLTCKAVQMKIAEGSSARLHIDARQLAIALYDDEGTELNAERGFLCGSIAAGVYIENPIE